MEEILYYAVVIVGAGTLTKWLMKLVEKLDGGTQK